MSVVLEYDVFGPDTPEEAKAVVSEMLNAAGVPFDGLTHTHSSHFGIHTMRFVAHIDDVDTAIRRANAAFNDTDVRAVQIERRTHEVLPPKQLLRPQTFVFEVTVKVTSEPAFDEHDVREVTDLLRTALMGEYLAGVEVTVEPQ